MLKNFNELGLALQEKYINEFDSKEIVLSEDFKDAYGSFLRSNSQNIDYSQFTATITSAGNLKMYIPNQWFKAAAFMVSYIIELIKYKQMVEEVIAPYIYSSKDKKQYFTDMKNTKDLNSVETFRKWAKDYLHSNGTENIESQVQYLSAFVADYEWWFGSKTIDRSDYYVSPVLYLLGVVNVSQTYIADISYNLATNRTLTKVSEEMIATTSFNESTILPNFGFENNQELLETRKTGGINEIVYGAPGTGKSRYLEDKYGTAPLTRRVVFHSEYSYYDFVGVYKPVPIYKETTDTFKTIDGKNVTIGEPFIDYKFVPGPFIKVLIEAWLDPKDMHTLLIEEINRADAASVFGEVFQLLDRDIEGNSEYAFEPSEDLKTYLFSVNGLQQYLQSGISIPSNMNIVATMNSSDQGVRPMDSAFKRRWNFHYVKINIKDAVHEKAEINYAGKKIYWGRLIDLINRKLSTGTIRLDEDKLIGPYFIKPQEIGKKYAIDKLLLYLWDDVLRHSRDSFFSSNVSCFSDISEKFAYEDVLDIMQSPDNINYLIVEKELEVNDASSEN